MPVIFLYIFLYVVFLYLFWNNGKRERKEQISAGFWPPKSFQNLFYLQNLTPDFGNRGLSAGFENAKKHFLIFRVVNDVTDLLRKKC